MKVLILSHLVPYPPTSGVLLRCYNLLREVARHHEVYLYAVNQSVLLEPGEPLRASIRHLEEHCAEVRVFEIPTEGSRLAYGWLLARNLLSAEPYSLPRFHAPALAAATEELLAREPIDLVQFETIAMAGYGELPGARRREQILVHQNVESRLLARRAGSEANPLARLYLREQARKLRRYEIRCLRHIGAHVAVSADDRAGLLDLHPDANVVVVENGVDLEYFRPGPEPAGRGADLVWMGGMSWYPNRDAIDWFLEAVWPRIASERPDATFTAIGSHPTARLESLAAADPARVRAPGLVPDVRPHVDPAALFVVPLRVGGGTRLKILDAWSMQKAVLSTSIGCEGLDARSGRDLVIADRADELAERALELLADREQRAALGRAGRARVEAEFGWPRVAEGMLALYEERRKAASSS